MNASRYLKGILAGVAALTMGASISAQAQDVKIGVTLSATGPAASLGVPERQAIEILPKTLGGLPVQYIVLDDATDPSTAAKNAKRFVEEEKVDAIIGSSTVPTSMAVAAVAAEGKTPATTLAPFDPKPGQFAWTFPLPQSVAVMSKALFLDMNERGVKTLGFIGFNGGYGEAWLQDVKQRAEANGIKLVAVERYARSDRSVTGQTLKLLGARPDAVLVAASGTPGVMPMRELKDRGYKGVIYQTHGMANNAVLRVAADAAEGMLLPTGPVLVAEQLPEDHPSKAVALDFLKVYEGEYGAGSRNNFAAYAYDAYVVLDRAVAEARKVAEPGTAEFRKALRDAIEGLDQLAVSHGVVDMTTSDHSGFDQRAAVLITVENGKWKLVE